MPASHKMVVLTRAVYNRVAELGAWYHERHIPDLLAIPGFVSGELMPVNMLKHPDGSPGWDFIAIYTIESDDPLECVKEAGRRMGTELMPRSDALESVSTISLLATPDA